MPDETAELGLAESGDGIFGTPRYLAPEQARGEPATMASDIFALGVVFYELATGKPRSRPRQRACRCSIRSARSIRARHGGRAAEPFRLARSCPCSSPIPGTCERLHHEARFSRDQRRLLRRYERADLPANLRRHATYSAHERG